MSIVKYYVDLIPNETLLRIQYYILELEYVPPTATVGYVNLELF